MTTRMQQVIEAMRELEAANPHRSCFTPNEIAGAVEPRLPMAGYGKTGRGHGLRRMAPATRVTPALTALRKAGHVDMTDRDDGLSGTAYYLTRDE